MGNTESDKSETNASTGTGQTPGAEPPAPDTGGEPYIDEEALADTDVEVGETNKELEEARARAEENWNNMLRAQAELDNVRKRAQRDVESARKFALEKFAQELLPVKDSLEMGVAAASGDDAEIAKLREGTELTLKMLGDVMEKFGIQEIDPLGEPFDPEWHQAMSMQEAPDKQPETVLVVMQKGYALNERLLRPAMVVVSKAGPGPEGGDDDDSLGTHVDEQA